MILYNLSAEDIRHAHHKNGTYRHSCQQCRQIVVARRLLQDAAEANHTSVSEFLLNAGVTAANLTLADRRQFVLDQIQWSAFQQALDRPVQSKPRLTTLLAEPGILM